MKMMLCSMLCMLTVLPSMAQRDTLSLNFGWTFSRDSLFRNVETVDLPHDFQIVLPWVVPVAGEKADSKDAAANTASRLSARGFKEMGCGWYLLKFRVDSLKFRVDSLGFRVDSLGFRV